MKNWYKTFLLAFLLFVLILSLLFRLNEASIYAKLGNFYAKKSDYAKSQAFFEKSYDLGNRDTDFRITYVNSLVNSPLTIDAQEKLVKIAEDEIKDSASESAEYFLRNLKKEIHNKYPDNYVKQATYNQQIIHWGKMPITYTFKNKRNIPDELVNAVDNAFDTWERASSVRVRFEKIPTDNANIVVTFTPKQFKNVEYGNKYVIASTTPIFNQKHLEKMEVNLGIYNLDGKLFTPNQMYNTALHEIFHALGFMGHSLERDNIMYMAYNKNVLQDDQRITLNDADKTTLELFYKIKPDITNADNLKYEYIPYLVVGDVKEVNSAKINEAKKYIKNAPTIPAGYIDIAQTLLNQKKYRLANNYLEKALILANNDETRYMVFYNLAITNYYDGNYDLAQVYINKAKEIKDESELHVLNAEVFIKQDKLKSAINEYKNLIKDNPKNIDYTINLANIYIKNKNYLKARKLLKDYVKNNPSEKKNHRLEQYRILLF